MDINEKELDIEETGLASCIKIFDFDDELLSKPENPEKYLPDSVEENSNQETPHNTNNTLTVNNDNTESISPPVSASRSILGRKTRNTRKQLAVSVPVPIPARLSANRANWIEYYEEDEDTTITKPHELAAKTYHDCFLKTGYELDIPTSGSSRISLLINKY